MLRQTCAYGRCDRRPLVEHRDDDGDQNPADPGRGLLHRIWLHGDRLPEPGRSISRLRDRGDAVKLRAVTTPGQGPPLVTVLVAVHNGGAALRASVDSILGQTFADFELVVVDDGSTDDTAGFLASVADSRLRVLSGPHQGLGAALRRGLDRARGEYIARQDADDIAHPDRLTAQVAFLDAHPDVVLVGAHAFMHDGVGKRLGVLAHPTSEHALAWRLL